MNRELFQKMSSWSQLFFLCLFSFLGLVFLSVILLLLTRMFPDEVQSIDFMRITVCIQSVFIFLLPACLCAFLFQERACEYLKINRPIDLKFLSLSILLIIAVQPLISFTSHYNNLIELPESLSGLEAQMKMWEEMAKATTEKLLITDSVVVLFINLLVIGVMAGITEEFFFRGSLQQIIKRIGVNSHVAVWVTAFIFSAIHFQFYGFIPRMLLGALLGYLFVWSGNLWIPVIVHAVNNMLSALMFHFFYGTPTYEKAENIGAGDTWWIALISLVFVTVLMLVLSKDYSENKPEDVTL
jgi:membrane protease YdiL (CAAX protease family)